MNEAIKTLEAELKHLYKARDDIQTIISTKNDELKKLIKLTTQNLVFTTQEIFNVYYNGYEVDSLYEQREAYFDRLSSEGSFRISRSGFLEETLQIIVSLAINKNISKEKLISCANVLTNYILPFIKPSNMNIGYGRSTNNLLCGKVIDIFEHTCSEHGCPDLMIADKYYILFTRYSNTTIEAEFSSLIEALEYIAKTHWY